MAKKRVRRVELDFKSSPLVEPPEEVQQRIMANAARAFEHNIGPHFVETAKSLTPVSEPRPFNPRRSSFEAVRLVSSVPGRTLEAQDKRERLAELRDLPARERADVVRASDIPLFVGTRGKNKGKTPDTIDVIRGSIKGAFQHKPGTLRDSIHLDGVTQGNDQVTLKVVASAPYAKYVIEGFTHTSGKHVAGRNFFKQALAVVHDRIVDPSTYSG